MALAKVGQKWTQGLCWRKRRKLLRRSLKMTLIWICLIRKVKSDEETRIRSSSKNWMKKTRLFSLYLEIEIEEVINIIGEIRIIRDLETQSDQEKRI